MGQLRTVKGSNDGQIETVAPVGRMRPIGARVFDKLIERLKKTGLAKGVVTDVAEMERVLGKAGYRALQGAHDLSVVNARWNQELRNFAKGKLKPHETLHLGKPLGILQAAGIKAKEMIVSMPTLRAKLKQHGLTTDDLQNLAEAIQTPVMVYEWGTKAKSTVIVTELTTKDGRKITVAVRAENKSGNLEVNDVASIHGKAAERFLSEMENAQEGGLKDALRYVDKEKALNWLGSATPRAASAQANQGLSESGANTITPNSAAKVIESFENPKIDEVFLRR